MTMRRIRQLLGLLALSLAACAAPPPDLTRFVHDSEGGIGGTGIFGPVDGPDGGRIAGLALPAEPPLARGEVAAVVAAAEGDGVVLRRVERIVALQGPVTAAAGADGTLRVMGATVRARDAAGPVDAAALAPGDRVAVSGLWDGATLVATRLAPASGEADRISGQTAADGTRIGGVALTRPLDAPGAAFAIARGRWSGRAFASDSTELRGTSPFGEPVARARIDGYLATDAAVGLHVSGLALPVAAEGRARLAPGARRVIEGPVDGALQARIVARP